MIEQFFIVITGVLAVYLSQDTNEKMRKWAPIFGLLSQPFWFWAAWKAEQWGIVLLCFMYGYSWGRGFYYQWIKGNHGQVHIN